MVSALLSRCLILVLGTLYPAYRSYKAIKNKDVKEYAKWMMYWIVFALFTTLETFLDLLMSWFPFYYEIKILFILWVLSPATRGSSLLYKKVVHPLLVAREKEIDEFIEKSKQQGYSTFLHLFTSGFQYASQIFVHSALKSHSLIESQLKKSLSLNDVNSSPPPPPPPSTQSNKNAQNSRNQPVIVEEEDDIEYDEEFENRLNEDQRIVQRRIIIQRTTTSNNEQTNMNNNEIDEQTDAKINRSGVVKRQSKRNLTNKQNTNAYKSNEASHFGTITRVKKSTTTATAKTKPQTINYVIDSDA